jgi:photosystem II stability/assembly factor-like uncharacterized protein
MKSLKYISIVLVLLLGCEKQTPELFTYEGGEALDPSSDVIVLTAIPSPYSGSLTAVAFSSPTKGFIGGTNDNLLLSTDTGWTWTLPSGGSFNWIDAITFTSESEGFVTAGNSIYRTVNSGASWIHYDPNTTSNFSTLHGIAVSANYGAAVGDNGAISRTTNGGASWYNWSFTNIFNDFYDIKIVGARAFICGESGFIARTLDFTSSQWYSATTPPLTAALHKFIFPSAQTGYCVGASGTILKSENWGTSWTDISFGLGDNLNAVAFQSETSGIVAGNGGTMYYTRDGGSNWSRFSTGISTDINDLVFNGTTYVAVGYNGVIFTVPAL